MYSFILKKIKLSEKFYSIDISIINNNSIIVLFGNECYVALDRNPGSGYNTLLLRLIPGDL